MMNNIHLYSKNISCTFDIQQSTQNRGLKSVCKNISCTKVALLKFKNIKKTNKKDYIR